jgi:hypothetical protein
MTTPHPASLLLAFALAGQDPTSRAAPAAPAISAAEAALGFRPLCDPQTGKGLRGFRKQGGFPAKGWAIENGVLRVLAKVGAGDLVTEDEFENFELRFDWKVTEGANSGIMYRVSEAEDWPWRTGPEYQVLDDQKHADGKDPRTSAAALYALVAATGKALKPVGEFNEGRLVVDGSQVEHWLNGQLVAGYELGSEAFRQLVAASKFRDMPNFGRMPKGRIALQDHGDEVWYRNLRVRTLPARGAPVQLWNGKDLTGWTGFHQDGAKVEDVWNVGGDGVLVCKGKPTGYLRTTADFTDFILEVEWRWSPETKQAGNSGVLVRMQAPDKVWPKSIEAQLQSGNAGDFWNIEDFPMQTDPARTKGRNTKKTHGNEKPLGEWNRYEIRVDGGQVVLKVNGQVLNEATQAAGLPGKICLQSEGTEIHFRTVRLIPLTR